MASWSEFLLTMARLCPISKPASVRRFEMFVFSDDAAAAERILSFVSKSRLVHVRGDPKRPWEDIALIARYRHHIVANSSFSWWGA